MFCDKVYKWFVSALQLAPTGIESKATVRVSWTAPRREMIDPVNEAKAMKDLVRSGFSSWEEAVKSLGFNPDELLEQLKKDFAKFQDAGLMFEWAPALMPMPGQQPGGTEKKDVKSEK
jgi:capsid protein